MFNLIFEMATVANNHIVVHLLRVVNHDDVVCRLWQLQRCLRHRGRRLWLGQGFPPFKAWRAQMASASVTTTRAPAHLRAVAQPLLTSPYPQTTDILPAIITSVGLIMPSGRE